MAGERIVNLMNSGKQAPTEKVDLMFGEVISISPLEIKVDNRFTIKEENILLSALVKEAVIEVNYSDNGHSHNVPSISSGVELSGVTVEGIDIGHSHNVPQNTTSSSSSNISLSNITLWRGLIVGDKVRMLRVSNGQLFYVIEREEGIL